MKRTKMMKPVRLFLALAAMPFLIGSLKAATQYVGAITQPVNVTNTVAVSGSVTSNVTGSTVTIATAGGSSTIPISAASLPLPTGAATSANQATEISSLSSIDGKITAVNTNAVTISAALPAGSNTIGKVDQGVGGASAWKVDGSAVTQPVSAASLPLPTGAATSAAQTTGNASLATIASAITSTVAVSVVGSVSTALVASSNVTKSSVSANGTSTQLLPAQSTRTGVECTSLCTNTDYVFININSASAATVTDYPMSPCSSWNPPAGMVPTGAIQVIANSGSQVVRCVSYTP